MIEQTKAFETRYAEARESMRVVRAVAARHIREIEERREISKEIWRELEAIGACRRRAY